VVQNVIVNCCRYTRSQLLVRARIDQECLNIVVADDGMGYPATMLESPSIWVQRAEVNVGNTHLGLYFAEQIAKLHRQKNRVGYIELTNGNPLSGGCFTLHLP
jgi:signal transduction histidine kinase